MTDYNSELRTLCPDLDRVEIAKLSALLRRVEVDSRIDEIMRFLDLSDSQSPEKYAHQRINWITELLEAEL